MSVENFEGEGLADQPSIIYGFEKDDSGEVEIRELSRSGFGSPGMSPGEVIERDSTKSTLDDRLPESDLPGEGGLQQDDCGDDLPAYSCSSADGCGKPVFVGRTCGSPACERCWPAAVKSKAVRIAGKLEGFRRALYGRYEGRRDIDFNHVVASLPWLVLDSDAPLERALLILQTLLEEQWGIEGFVAIFHPYRIKKEYRKDQYDHGGEAGEGEMTWADVLDEDDPSEYLTFEPHFHTFFAAPRGSFDYMTAKAIEEDSGWLFHRVTKGEESNVSVSDLSDLVHQLTYCFSHAGVIEKGGRAELASRMKGDLHDCYIPQGVEEEVVAIFCEAAPKLLGTRFANLSGATCDADVSVSGGSDGESEESGDVCEDCRKQVLADHPLEEVWNPDGEVSMSGSSGSDPWSAGTLDAGAGGEGEETNGWVGEGSSSRSSSDGPRADSEADVNERSESGASTGNERCGGELRPIHEAADRLEDEEWCEQAEHVDGLRRAVAEWRRRTGGSEELAWTDEDDEDGYPEVVQDD